MPGEWQVQFEKSASVTCAIDAESRIIYCNPSWDNFALANEGTRATTEWVVGRSLFDYLPPVLEPHYRKLIGRSRCGTQHADSDYECHSADRFRIYHLRVQPIPGTDLLAMVHSLRVERAMTFETLEVSDYHHGLGNVVTMCSQCRRTKNNLHRQWDWLPEFVRRPPRRTSHGICPDCVIYLYA